MARKFLTPIDLTKLEIQNVALQNLGSDPGTPATGQIYFNTGGTVKVYNGTSWLSLSTTGGTVTSVTGTSPVVSSGGTTPDISLASGYGDTLNPYASKSANTILAAPSGSGGTPSFRSLAAADIPSTLNATTFGGAVAMGTNRITGLGEPSGAQDAVTKSYVDNISKGLNAHEAVAYATTGALGTAGNLVGGTITTTYANGTAGVGATITVATSSNWTAITIDGQSLTVTDRVLIKNQASNVQNGIYTVTSVGAVGNTTSFVFTRALDIDEALELASGDLTYVIAGTANGGNGYVLTTPVTTVGTSPVVWSQFSGASSTLAGAGLVTNGSNPNQVDVGAGTGITVASDSVAIDTAVVPRLTSANSFTVGGHTITNDAVGTLPLLIKGASGQTANLLELQRSDLSVAFRVRNNGNFGAGGLITSTTGFINNDLTGSSSIGFVIRGAAGQSADLQEWQNSGGTAIANVSSTGTITSTQYLKSLGFRALSDDSVVFVSAGSRNLQLFSATSSVGGGNGVLGIANATTAPTSNPTGGGVLYVDGGALKYRGTSGSAATIVNADGSKTVTYADLPTNVGVVARKVSLVGTGTGQTIALTHGLGTNLVTAQVYDTSTSTATLVDTDITVTSTVATATFASASTTLSNYTLVVIG
jgi:hypothetical protein